MLTRPTLTAAAFAWALATPALADITWSIESTLARQSGSEAETTLDLFPSLTATLPFDSGWSLDIEANPELYFNHTGGTSRADDPYLNFILSLITPQELTFGLDASTTFADWSNTTDTTLAAFIAKPNWRATFGDTAAAASELCLTPDLRTLDDLTETDACPVFLETGMARLVIGPEGGLRHGFSYGQDNGTTSASYALTGPLGPVSFSLGAEVSTTGTRRDHLLQAGVSYAANGWTLALATAIGQSADGTEAALQAEATRQVTDRLTLSLAATQGNRNTAHETGLGLAADWIAVPDRLTVTAGLARIWTATGQDSRASLTLILSGKSVRRCRAAKQPPA
jgi:hypothetical protein